MRHALIAALLAGAPAHAQTSTVHPTVHIEGAWSRATSPQQKVGAAYLTLTSPVADQLTGASSPVAGAVQVHEMQMDGAVMRMREVSSVDLPPAKAVALAPGGYHIMLMDLHGPLTIGQTFPLHLTFAHGAPADVQVVVQPVGATGPSRAESGVVR